MFLWAGLLLAASVSAQQAPPFDLISGAVITEGQGGFQGSLAIGAKLGTSLASLGDLDGDGVGDLAVGATGTTGGGVFTPSSSGDVWILFLAPTGTVVGQTRIGDGIGGFDGDLDDGDKFGSAVAALGDLDGDGVGDLAVGAEQDDDGGPNRGAVWILFLRPDGSVKGRSKISATAGGFTGALDNQDRFGAAAAAAGDMDGDGTPDLLVGAPRDDDGASGAGAVWLLYLYPDGTVKGHAKISATSGGFGGPLSTGDRFGSAIAALGDLDGDGVGDLAVGAPFGQFYGGGQVWVLFLRADGTVRRWRPIPGPGVEPWQNPYKGQFGAALAALGDVDGDGHGDLAVGAPQADYKNPPPVNPEGGLVGAAWVLLLGHHGQVKGRHKLSDLDSWGLPGPPLGVAEAFGSALAGLDDHDGDGFLDLAVGVPLASDAPQFSNTKGALRVFLAGIRDDNPPLCELSLHGNQVSASVRIADERPSEDLDDSGLLDPGEDLNGNGAIDTDQGVASVALVAGSDNLTLTVKPFAPGAPEVCARLELLDSSLPGRGALVLIDMVGNRSECLVTLTAGPNQTLVGEVITAAELASPVGTTGLLAVTYDFGSAVVLLGDLDGDGLHELAVGDPTYGPGAVWIVTLDDAGAVHSATRLDTDSGPFRGLLDSKDDFGAALAAPGDLDGDGVPDLVVGAPGDNDGATAAGAVWIVYLLPNGQVKGHAKISTTQGGLGTAAGSFWRFGTSVACLGDLNGDGRVDLAVGAPGFGGGVWILFLAVDGSVDEAVNIGPGSGGFEGSLGPIDLFGSSLAVLGDADGDGVPELAVGAPGDDGPHGSPYTTVGAVWILFLARDGTASHEVELDYEDLPLSHPDRFGSSLAALGDLDGNGVVDLAVGAKGNDEVWVLFLEEQGALVDTRRIGELSGDFPGCVDAGDAFGAGLAPLGDLDGDGAIDLAVGVPTELPTGPPYQIEPGAVWLLRLNAVVDTNAPSCALAVDLGGTFAVGTAADDRSSEDRDGDLILDKDEDLNGNQRIDMDSGLASVALDPGAVNLVLLVEPFEAGTPLLLLKVALEDVSRPGSGTLRVVDVAGNETARPVRLVDTTPDH